MEAQEANGEACHQSPLERIGMPKPINNHVLRQAPKSMVGDHHTQPISRCNFSIHTLFPNTIIPSTTPTKPQQINNTMINVSPQSFNTYNTKNIPFNPNNPTLQHTRHASLLFKHIHVPSYMSTNNTIQSTTLPTPTLPTIRRPLSYTIFESLQPPILIYPNL